MLAMVRPGGWQMVLAGLSGISLVLSFSHKIPFATVQFHFSAHKIRLNMRYKVAFFRYSANA